MAGRRRRFDVEEITKVKRNWILCEGQKRDARPRSAFAREEVKRARRLVVSVVDFRPHGIIVILILPS